MDDNTRLSKPIPDWYRSWKESHEGLKQRLQNMADQWLQLSEEIEKQKAKQSTLNTAKELLKKAIEQAQADVMTCENIAERTKNNAGKANTALHKILDKDDGKSHFTKARLKLEQQKSLLRQATSEFTKQHDTLLAIQAKQQYLNDNILQAEQLRSNEQRVLDMWMQRFNSNNPPVQMAELERVLADGRNWNQTRLQVRENAMQIAVLQARVDYLRAQIIALQANGLRPISGNGEAEQMQIKQKIAELENKRRDILMEIAKADETLRRHQQTLSQQ